MTVWMQRGFLRGVRPNKSTKLKSEMDYESLNFCTPKTTEKQNKKTFLMHFQTCINKAITSRFHIFFLSFISFYFKSLGTERQSGG